ncbi:MAG: ribose-phosphate pyrophosphokinase [Armatimonadetes bacterium]|nr:ribose-phosphate pyrophosphokinase [Armatimonadota bacterium]
MANGATIVKVFATSGTSTLGGQVESELRHRIGNSTDEYRVEHGSHIVSWFSNENIEVQVDNVRDHIALVLHTQTPPVNDGVIELLAMLDAINNAHPRRTFVAFPYMPYSRSDRKNKPRISVMGQRLPEILNEVLGVRRVLLFEPHNGHIKQYYVPTADEVPVVPLLVKHIQDVYLTKYSPADCTLVFADAGAAKRFEDIPATLGIDPTYIYKTRADNSESPSIKAIAGQVKDRHCFILDDEILTGNTVIKDADLLKAHGAASVRVFAVHGILADQKLSTEALMAKLDASPIDEFILTDSIPLADKVCFAPRKFTILPIAPLVGEACMRLILGESLSELHRLPS